MAFKRNLVLSVAMGIVGGLAAYAGITPSTGAFTAPNTTASLNAFDGGVPAGTWSFKVSDFEWDVVPCDRMVEGC